MPNSLQTLIQSGPVLCDGAMGTQLMARGLKNGQCSERWNTERPDDIRAIHRAYLQAGCRLLTTNTFGGTSLALGKHDLGDRVMELNTAGVRLAREVAGTSALVLGDVGPLGDFLEPVGEITEAEAMELFGLQMRALAQAGADALIIETMSDPAEMAAAIKAAKTTERPIIATYAYNKPVEGQFRTMMGTALADATRAALEAGADVVGANCGTGLTLEEYRALAGALLSAAGGAPVILQPNAGTPHQVDGRLQYDATPQDMGRLAADVAKTGIQIIGGCCGTTPDHLAAMAKALRK